jgi:hypothetical protein
MQRLTLPQCSTQKSRIDGNANPNIPEFAETVRNYRQS